MGDAGYEGAIRLDRSCCLRLDIVTPTAKSYITNGEARYEYLPDEHKAYRHRADSGFRAAEFYELFLGMRRYLDLVRPVEATDLGNGLKRVRLVPKNTISHIAGILLEIEADSGMLRRAVVTDMSGAELGRLALTDYRLEPQLEEGAFEPPSGARIYTPMTERLGSDR
jgi:hypothetical protein